MLDLFEDFPLKGQELRNWLRTSGQAIFTEFASGSAALDFARGFGMQIRDSDFFAIRRQVLAQVENLAAVKALTDETLIPLAWTVTDHGWSLSENFLYRMKVFGTDPNTGAEVEKFFAISSNHQMTPGEAKAQLAGMLAGEEDFYEVSVDSIELDTPFARPEIFE